MADLKYDKKTGRLLFTKQMKPNTSKTLSVLRIPMARYESVILE